MNAPAWFLSLLCPGPSPVSIQLFLRSAKGIEMMNMNFLALRKAKDSTYCLLLKGLGLGQRDHTHTPDTGRAVGVNDNNMICHLQIHSYGNNVNV